MVIFEVVKWVAGLGWETSHWTEAGSTWGKVEIEAR